MGVQTVLTVSTHVTIEIIGIIEIRIKSMRGGMRRGTVVTALKGVMRAGAMIGLSRSIEVVIGANRSIEIATRKVTCVMKRGTCVRGVTEEVIMISARNGAKNAGGIVIDDREIQSMLRDPRRVRLSSQASDGDRRSANRTTFGTVTGFVRSASSIISLRMSSANSA